MVKNRQPASRSVPFISYAPPAGTPGGVEVLSLTELHLRAREGALSVPRRPTFHHLVTLSSGALRNTVDFREYMLEPGSWLWARPGQVHQWDDLRHAEGTVIIFEPDFLDPATVQLEGRRYVYSSPLLTPVGYDLTALQLATEHLRHEFQQASHVAPDVAVLVLRHLLAALVLRLATLPDPNHSEAQDHLSTIFVDFREVVEQNFANVRRVEDYAALLAYSPRTLSRATIAAAGVGAKEFIDRRVLLEAKRLLTHSDESAAQIGGELGFTDAANFSQFFRRRAGASPIDFRNSVHGDRLSAPSPLPAGKSTATG
jgi:AraC-like DNA-binding protein